jgi:hypothetical protein
MATLLAREGLREKYGQHISISLPAVRLGTTDPPAQASVSSLKTTEYQRSLTYGHPLQGLVVYGARRVSEAPVLTDQTEGVYLGIAPSVGSAIKFSQTDSHFSTERHSVV